MRPKKGWFCIILLLLLLLAACSQANNYADTDVFLFEGSYAENAPQFSGSIKVVSWNTNYGQRLDQIITAFTETDALINADVILLQEMDETNVDLLAQALKYNYVYYPATIHPQNDRNFGNAILAPWPLSGPQRILLPNPYPDFKQDRIAVKADVLIDDVQLTAYSVHLEHLWMLPGLNDSQVEVLVDQVSRESSAVVVGGDFNSWSPGSITTLDELFGEIGLRRVSKGVGPTLETVGGALLTVDHIFASKYSASQAGAWHQTEISDHTAVWAILSMEEVQGKWVKLKHGVN